MDKAIASDNAYQFVKMLVELGGVHYVGDDLIIYGSSDDSPIGVKTGVPPKKRPIAVFKEGMSVGDYVVLNPFTDVLANSPERAWFTNKMCAFPGSIIRHIVRKMIEVGLSNDKNSGYKANKFVSKWIDKIDEKLLEESQRIEGKYWARIFYDRSSKIAQLQSDIGTEDLKNEFKSKIRKSSWPIFVDMLKTLLQLGAKKPESMIYESKVVSIPKIDAILHLLIDVLTKLDPATTAFTDVKIPVKELAGHIDHLDAYREATKWFATATATNDADQTSRETESVAPWAVPSSTTEPVGQVVPVGGTGFELASPTASDAMTVARLAPVGVIYNNNFGGAGSIQNPNFGMPIMGGCGMPQSPLGIRPW